MQFLLALSCKLFVGSACIVSTSVFAIYLFIV